MLVEVRGDRVVRLDQHLRRRQTAIDGDVLSPGYLRQAPGETVSRDEGRGKLGIAEPRRKVPAKRNN